MRAYFSYIVGIFSHKYALLEKIVSILVSLNSAYNQGITDEDNYIRRFGSEALLSHFIFGQGLLREQISLEMGKTSDRLN